MNINMKFVLRNFNGQQVVFSKNMRLANRCLKYDLWCFSVIRLTNKFMKIVILEFRG